MGYKLEWIDLGVFNLGVVGFADYCEKIEAALAKLQPGRCYRITDEIISRQLIFLGVVKTYILTHPDYYLSDNETKIYRK